MEDSKYSRILLIMTALLCLAFQGCAVLEVLNNITPSNLTPSSSTVSSGDWISPNIGQVSTRTNSDPGLAGMLHWLDTPVPNFPWYTTGGSFFYSQPYKRDHVLALYRVLYNHWFACRGWDHKQSNQVRYNPENTFHCVLRCRCRLTIHPVCIHSAIQDQ